LALKIVLARNEKKGTLQVPFFFLLERMEMGERISPGLFIH